MPATYEPIATTTLGSAAISITFSSISSAYTDLKIIMTVASGPNSNAIQILFNSNSADNYSRTSIIGDGSTATSTRASNTTNGLVSVAGASATQPTFVSVDIFSYANTSVNKTWLSSHSADANGSGVVGRIVGLWRNTSAINTILLRGNVGDFAAGTTATLYGVKNA